MPFSEILRSFAIPALLLLEQCCQAAEAFDAVSACGLVWALAALWRVHSGGGVLLPGGVDTSLTASLLSSECLRRADDLDKEISTRALEELVVDGHCGLEPANSQAQEEVCLWRRQSEELKLQCRLRPPLALEPLGNEANTKANTECYS
ncbi:unnamed protein product [Effrenium voratum]|nr:unnamed protein product [Effrenium voratum]